MLALQALLADCGRRGPYRGAEASLGSDRCQPGLRIDPLLKVLRVLRENHFAGWTDARFQQLSPEGGTICVGNHDMRVNLGRAVVEGSGCGRCGR
jgi:hypothetical protein